MGPRSMITVHYMGGQAKKKCYTVMIDDQSIFTTVTNDPDVVTEWVESVDSISAPCSLGFEIEFDFKTLRIGTLQLSLVNRCLVFQLLYPSTFPPALVEFLADPYIILVGSHVGSKIGLLRSFFPCFQPLLQGKDFVVNAAFLIDRKKTELMGSFVETDWDRLPLTLSVEQAHHACLDAFLNLRILELLPPPPPLNYKVPFLTTIITPHVGTPGDDKDLYDVILYGQTVWVTVTNLNAVREWITVTENLEAVNIAFEVEFDITTRRVGTVQFFAANRCLVFRLLDSKNCPPFLDEFLNTHAFAGGREMLASVEALRRQFKFKAKVSRVGMRGIVDELKVSRWKKEALRSIGLGNGDNQWGRPSNHLSDKEVHYACIRVYLNLIFTSSFRETN